jgi:uncharacterized membrane protein YhaH (DUF805 family)
MGMLLGLGGGGDSEANVLALTVTVRGLFLPIELVVIYRRFRDLAMSSWYMVCLFIPVANIVLVVYLLAKPSPQFASTPCTPAPDAP